MFRVKQSTSGYRNLELTESEFLTIATGAPSELGTAIWSHEIQAYVNTLSADAVPLAYVTWNRENLP